MGFQCRLLRLRCPFRIALFTLSFNRAPMVSLAESGEALVERLLTGATKACIR